MDLTVAGLGHLSTGSPHRLTGTRTRRTFIARFTKPFQLRHKLSKLSPALRPELIKTNWRVWRVRTHQKQTCDPIKGHSLRNTAHIQTSVVLTIDIVPRRRAHMFQPELKFTFTSYWRNPILSMYFNGWSSRKGFACWFISYNILAALSVWSPSLVWRETTSKCYLLATILKINAFIFFLCHTKR